MSPRYHQPVLNREVLAAMSNTKYILKSYSTLELCRVHSNSEVLDFWNSRAAYRHTATGENC